MSGGGSGIFFNPRDSREFHTFWRINAAQHRPATGQHRSSGLTGKPDDRVGGRKHFARSVGAALEFDLAFREAPRPDEYLPWHADQIGGGELGTWPLVKIVI